MVEEARLMVALGSKLGKARLRDMLCSRIGYAYG